MGRKATFSTAQMMLSLQSYFADAKGSEETSTVVSRTDLDLDLPTNSSSSYRVVEAESGTVSRFQTFV